MPVDEQNFDLIIWDSKLELGIPIIDRQHRHLVDLCNTLHKDLMTYSATSGGTTRWRELISNVLREMVDYTKSHFGLEEKLMQEAEFEGLPQHRHEHQEFIEKVAYLLKGFSSASLQTAFEIVRFLRDWILSHVAHSDRLYVKSLKEYIEKSGWGKNETVMKAFLTAF